MARWPLLGGSYTSQGLIANAQRCVNLYPEKNPSDSPVPVTYYSTPGLRQAAAGVGLGRRMYVASDKTWYGVSGSVVWWRDANGNQNTLGTIPLLQTPVQFVDNGITLVITDGTETGAWQIDLATKAFSTFTDSTGLFQGASLTTYLDTFTVFNVPGTRQFISTLSNSMTFDPLYIASKTGQPDLLVGPVVVHRELWLLGEKTSEIWTTVADQDFPFAILPGAFIQYGCAAPASATVADVSLYWLAQNEQGQGMVLRGKGYQAERISTHALEQEIQRYSTISDAIAYSYQENGHIFYVLSFPTANKTWVYDEATTMWHQRAWVDSNGKLNRHRVMSAVSAYGKIWGQDWETGAIYEMSTEFTTDFGQPIIRVRSFPHLPRMEAGGKVVALDGKRIKYYKFSADITVGQVASTTSKTIGEDVLLDYDSGVDYGHLLGDAGPDDFGILLDGFSISANDPKLMLRWSNTRGSSWQGTLVNSLGAAGEYYTMPSWRRLGTARDRVWELSWVAAAEVVLNGAWVEMAVMRS